MHLVLAALLSFVLAAESHAATRCNDTQAGRRCVTVDAGQLRSVCVTRGVTRTCTHYDDGRAVRHCVRIGGRNRCLQSFVRVA